MGRAEGQVAGGRWREVSGKSRSRPRGGAPTRPLANSPLRILAIAPTGFYADYGCHVRIRGQLQALQALGHEIRLLTYPAGQNVPGLRITRPPLPFSRTMPVGSSRRKILLDALLVPTALAAALRFRPDIVHAYLHEGALIGWAIARLLQRPLTADYQGSLTAEMIDHRFLSARSPFLPGLRGLEAWIEQQPDAIFTSSGQALTRLEQQGLPPTRLLALPDSIDAAQFAPRPPDPALAASLGLNLARPLVVYLGLLAPYQGTDLLLQAIAHPRLADSPAQFLIMGFPDVAKYRALAEALGIADRQDTAVRVRFTGQIPYAEAPRYLALGDLAVAPKLSATEGSGKLLPYMSMALPVVATDTPVHREYLGEEGVWVQETGPEGLASAIGWGLAHLVELEPKGARLRLRAQRRYTWEAAAEEMTSVFQKLSTGGAAGGDL